MLSSQGFAECYQSLRLTQMTSSRSTIRQGSWHALKFYIDCVFSNMSNSYGSRKKLRVKPTSLWLVRTSCHQSLALRLLTDFCGSIFNIILDTTVPDADKREELEAVMEVSLC